MASIRFPTLPGRSLAHRFKLLPHSLLSDSAQGKIGGVSEIHIHVHADPDPRIAEILRLTRVSLNKENIILSDLSAINTALDTLTSEVDAAAAELDELAQAVRDGGLDPAELAAVADRIAALSTSLHDATARDDVVSPPEPTPEPT